MHLPSTIAGLALGDGVAVGVAVGVVVADGVVVAALADLSAFELKTPPIAATPTPTAATTTNATAATAHRLARLARSTWRSSLR
jgi:hypothetical protein